MADKILIVDDEKLIVKGLKFSIEADGYETDVAYDGEEALEKAKNNKYSLILLDLMLPKMDGMEVCRQIRTFSDVPVIFLTAKGDDMDKILGFESGADDYIVKPFNVLEVKARIKVIMKRTSRAKNESVKKDSMVQDGEFKFDIDNRSLFIKGREINLTAKEFDLVELLIRNPNRVYSRENLLDIIWGDDYRSDIRTVDVHIKRLREKLPDSEKYGWTIHTVRGVGYKFSA